MSCSRPFKIKKNGKIYEVPCRWCMSCRIDRQNEWADRINFECRGKRNSFVTLTYRDKNLPAKNSLRYIDARRYLEVIRQELKKQGRKLKYYITGEYSDTGRPHYHLIMIDIDYVKDAQLIASKWRWGLVQVLPAMQGCIRYVLKYMLKEQHGDQAKEIYDDNGIERPFGHMSKGIGRQWLAEHMQELEQNGGYHVRGKLRPIPEYYKNLIGISGQDPTEKYRQWKENTRRNGNNDIEEWRKATGLLKEKHLIKQARSKGQSIDDYYLENYQEPSQYKVIIKEIENFEKEYLCNQGQNNGTD